MAISITVENEHNRVKISGLSTSYASTIERKSSLDKYTSAETFNIGLNNSNSIYYDYLVEAGVIYKYKITENSSIVYNATTPFFIGSEGAYLYGLYKNLPAQLKFIYNSQVSSFSKVRKDSIIETIGGQYPFVVRSAELGYKAFSFSGMIVSNMDSFLSFSGGEYSKLVSEGVISNSTVNTDYLNAYKSPYSPSINQNFVLEKFFRRTILNWLTDGSLKIFKSDTEGMFLGKISDVSLERVESLNGLLYNVSFSFTEVGPATYAGASAIIQLSKTSDQLEITKSAPEYF